MRLELHHRFWYLLLDAECKEESELLQEWFDLMRERTELRHYERELMVRAQEMELEDRHARLRQELQERMSRDGERERERERESTALLVVGLLICLHVSHSYDQ
jgi:hypothetical protein